MPPSGSALEPVLNRRRVLSGGMALAALAIAAPACGAPPPPPPAVDELEAQLTLARQDSELATAAAVGTEQHVNAALTQVAVERGQHAEALATEVKRLAPPSSATSSPTTTTTVAVAAPPPPLAAVVTSLKASADSARELAAASSGYRAGLLGSIAASCTASFTVALAFGAATS